MSTPLKGLRLTVNAVGTPYQLAAILKDAAAVIQREDAKNERHPLPWFTTVTGSMCYDWKVEEAYPETKKPKACALKKKFGHGGRALENGSLSHHIGWLEALASDEEESMGEATTAGPASERLKKVQDAIQLLYDAAAMSKEDQE